MSDSSNPTVTVTLTVEQLALASKVLAGEVAACGRLLTNLGGADSDQVLDQISTLSAIILEFGTAALAGLTKHKENP